uniref:Uncharacterized protein n=1 Tax=Glossina brevipalpis TaxID=37001 RepID=A0A1A9WQ45_9MUSC
MKIKIKDIRKQLLKFYVQRVAAYTTITASRILSCVCIIAFSARAVLSCQSMCQMKSQFLGRSVWGATYASVDRTDSQQTHESYRSDQSVRQAGSQPGRKPTYTNRLLLIRSAVETNKNSNDINNTWADMNYKSCSF